MMKSWFASLDFWGFTTSLLCAIHCALLPLLLSLGLISGSLSWINHPLFEIVIAILTCYFVYQSLIKGYSSGKVHFSTFLLAIVGLLCIIFHHFLGNWATTTVVIGGSLIAFAHFQNLFYYYKNQRVH